MGKEFNDENTRYKPITAWGYVGYTILYSIPVIGWIIFLVFTFSSKNLNRRSFTRSFWCWFLLSIIIILLFTTVLLVSGNIEANTLLTTIKNGRIDEAIRMLNPVKSISMPSISAMQREAQSSQNQQNASSDTEAVIIGGKKVFVNREFKRFMDSYEDTMMVYIEALKSGNANKIISATKKYADALNQLNEVNEDSLSDADMAYYLDVTNRVNQQLLLSQ